MKSNWSITVKGKPETKNPTLIQLKLVFYKNGFARVPKVLAITGLSEFWNEKTSQFTSDTAEHEQLNIDIKNEWLKYRLKAEEWDRKGKDWAPIELSHCFDQPITKPEKKEIVFVSEMIDTIISEFSSKLRVKGARKLSSSNNAKNYQFLKNSLEKFTKLTYSKDFNTYTFPDIKTKFLEDYVVYIKLEGNKKGNKGGLKHKLKNFQAVFSQAKVRGLSDVNLSIFKPISEHMKEGQRTSSTVSYDIIERIENFDMSTYSPKDQLYRGLFLFTFYAGGMAPVDVCNLTQDQIKDVHIEYERTKCTTWAKPILTNKVLELINKHKGECFKNYVLPVFKEKHETEKQKHERCERVDKKVNDLLKEICKKLKIKDKVTWYSARGAFITEMVKRGFDIMEIAEQAGTSPDMIHKHYYTNTNRESTKAEMNRIFGKSNIKANEQRG